MYTVLIERLRSLASGEAKPLDIELGICHEVRMMSRLMSRPVLFIIVRWPEHSGHSSYPVRHPKMSPQDAFMEGSDLWQDDEYGKARKRLCIFIADELEKDLTLMN